MGRHDTKPGLREALRPGHPVFSLTGRRSDQFVKGFLAQVRQEFSGEFIERTLRCADVNPAVDSSAKAPALQTEQPPRFVGQREAEHGMVM